MCRLLRADLYRLYHSKKVWISLLAMFAAAGMMITMQYTAMDYEVPLSRVLFLPMTFYGLVLAALIGFFTGEDFSEGTVRNKIVAGNKRSYIYRSQMICTWSVSLLLYFVTTAFTVSVGLPLFARDVGAKEIITYWGLGAFTVLAMGSVFYFVTMCIGNRSIAVSVCMAMAFLMLFLCLHTNQILVQPPYKEGVANLHYVSGIKRMCYELLHDINPMGQIAQLSEMKCINAVRWIVVDIVLMSGAAVLGNAAFKRKDVR